MRNGRLKRAAAAALSILFCAQSVMAGPLLASVPGSADAVEEKKIDDAAAEQGLAEHTDVIYDRVETFYPMTSAPQFRPFSLISSSDSLLRDGHYADWIDRVDVPQYAMDIYTMLSQEDFWTNEENFSENPQAKLPIVKTTFQYNSDSSEEKSEEAVCIKAASYPYIDGNEKEYSDIRSSINAAVAALDRDHPEIFWSTWSFRMVRSSVYNTQEKRIDCIVYLVLKSVITKKDGSKEESDVRSPGYQSAAAITGAIDLRDSRVKDIVSGASGSDYNKVKYFNEWLTHHNAYNSAVASGNSSGASKSAWECISALSGKSGVDGPVCEGYARAFKVLCDTEGIPCTLVDGTAISSSSSGAHMWNYVQLDDDWYGVDVTWNDPLYGDNAVVSGGENTRYLCVGSQTVTDGQRTFLESHPVTNKVFGGDELAFTNGPELSLQKYEEKNHAEVTNIDYGTTYTYSGAPIPSPQGHFESNGGALSYEWYQGDQKLEGEPVDAGEYRLHVVAEKTEQYAKGSLDVTVTISKANQTLTVPVSNFEKTYGDGQFPLGCSTDGDGEITYTTNDSAVEVSAEGLVTIRSAGSAEITVSLAEGRNYTGTSSKTITVNVGTGEVEIQSGEVSLPEGSEFTYGDKLSKLKLQSPVFADSKNGETVDGELAWKNPDETPGVAEKTAEWVFRPADPSYAELTGPAEIVVRKATPDVTAPELEDLTYDPSRTLSDIVLSGAGSWTVGGEEVTVDGSWEWTEDSTVPEAGEHSFEAVFTPEDAENYNTVTCSVSLNIQKAHPYIKELPTASVTYGMFLRESEPSGGVVCCSEENDEQVAGSFAWDASAAGEKPTVVDDSGTTLYSVIFTPEDVQNYETAETEITVTVNKAQDPPSPKPKDVMNPGHSVQTVGEIKLPTDWEWYGSDSEKELIDDEEITATAVYVGSDKGNYENESVSVSITRSSCDHENIELRNSKESTCTEDGYTGDTYCTDCDTTIHGGETIPAGHKFDEPVWTWDGYESASATFTCSRCGESQSVPAEITKETADGTETYTARVEFEEKNYEDSRIKKPETTPTPKPLELVFADSSQKKALKNRTTGDKDFTLNLKAKNGQKLKNWKYTSGNSKIVKILDNNQLRFAGVGETKVAVTAVGKTDKKTYSIKISVNVKKPGKPTVTLSSKKAKKKYFIVTTGTVRGASGFQVQYSLKNLKKTEKGAKKVSFASGSKLSKKNVKAGKSKKKYYVRVRAYQKVNGKKVYGDWSSVKTVKSK